MNKVVQSLLLVNAALWVVWLLVGGPNPPARVFVPNDVFDLWALFPVDSVWFRWWQPVTYMFMHGSWEHIVFNMFTLWMFGRFIERDLGARRFLIYYLVCGVGAGLIQLLVCYLTGSGGMTVGASGAIYGLLLAFAVLHPNDIIMPLIPPIPMRAKWAILVFCGIELFLGVRGELFSADNVAHFAHLGGALWGWLLLMFWRFRSGGRMRGWQGS